MLDNRTYNIVSISVFLLVFPFIISSTFSQTLSEQANDSYTSSNYKGAIPLYKKLVKQYKEAELHDSVYATYERLQYCYTNQFKLDSSCYIFEEAADYARLQNNQKRFNDLKVAIGEIRYIQGNLDLADSIFRDVLDNQKTDNFHKSRIHYRLSNIEANRSNADKAKYHIEEAIKYAIEDKDTSIIGSIYESQASIEARFGDKLKAIQFYLNSLPFLQNQQKAMILSSTYRKMAAIFQSLSNHEKALEYTQLSYHLADEKKYKREKAFAANLLGEIFLENKEYAKAIDYFEEARAHFELKKNFDYLISINCDLAMSYLQSGQATEANKSISRAEEYLDKGQIISFNFKYHYIKALLELENGQTKNVLFHLKACKNILPELDEKNALLHVYNLEKKYYQSISDFKSSLVASDNYHIIKDSLYQLKQSQIIHNIEAQYQNAEQEKEIKLLNAEKELNESLLSQQRIIIFGGALALLIFGLLSLFIYRLYKKVSSQNELINQSLDAKDTLLREIHHRVKNNLQVISSLLALQSKYVTDDNALTALKQGQDRVQSMALIHQDLYETESLQGVNAHQYLHQLTDNLFDSFNIDENDITLNIDVDDIILDVDTMIPLGLIINELISNAFKHAFNKSASGEVNLILKDKLHYLYLEVNDNGTGVANVNQIEGKSFGFELVKAFAKKLNAQIELDNKNGLKVQLKIKKYKIAS